VRRTFATCLLAAALAIVPAGTALHLSAGAHDNVAVASEEETEDPSVPPGDYERGVGLADSCEAEPPDPEPDPAEARRTLEADGFCGELVYHEGTGQEQVSPPDQDVRSDRIGSFDVVTAQYAGVPTAQTCAPFCADYPAGAGDLTWQLAHTAGAAVGATDDAGTADDAEGSSRNQAYHVTATHPQAATVLQSTTDAWAMNGWMNPSTTRTYVGFLTDADEDPISDTELREDVLPNSGDLGDDAVPRVCGFSAQIEYDATFPQINCDIALEYQAPSNDGDVEFRGYDDECQSPTYVCGGIGGANWYAEAPCAAICDGTATAGGYLAWHWIVAPSTSNCEGAQQPGATFRPPAGADEPYLAHDLDVYTPVSDVSGGGAEGSAPVARDYALGIASDAQDQAIDALGDALDTLPDLPRVPDEAEAAVDESVSTAANASLLVAKTPRVEPNNAEPVGGLDDTSQSVREDLGPGDTLQRTVDEGPCSMFEDGETEETVDPWVDYVDGRAWIDLTAGGLAAGTYANDDPSQDQHNNPTTSPYYTQGQVGFFTDKDDDGSYDQAASDQKYQADEIRETGAYPMLWDMHVDEAGEPADNAGCDVQGEPLPAIMDDMGYGPYTGLVQAIYLKEPSAVIERESADTVPFPAGNNIYLLMSQAAHEFVEVDGTTENPIDGEVEHLVAGLRTYALENGAPSEPAVVRPGTMFDTTSAFADQCPEPTGGFTSDIGFLHDCSLDCEGDTIVTLYTADLETDRLYDTEIPGFSVDGANYELGAGQHVWYDVDPFDGDPDRNRDESSAPPT